MAAATSPLRGYKPHVAEAVLGISRQTFENWRKQLDPQPNRTALSTPVLLAYRIITSLIRNRLIRVGDLKKINVFAIFEICEAMPSTQLETYTLVLDVAAKKIFLTRDQTHLADLDYIALKLDRVVAAHRDALLNLGATLPRHPLPDLSAYIEPAPTPSAERQISRPGAAVE